MSYYDAESGTNRIVSIKKGADRSEILTHLGALIEQVGKYWNEEE